MLYEVITRKPDMSVNIGKRRFISFGRKLVLDIQGAEPQFVVQILVIRVIIELDQDRRKIPVGFGLDIFNFLQSVESILDRITSYNVCYTKLLRGRKFLPLSGFHPD